ncbi:MAG TPA: dehydrogenase [Desulfobacterales bacterium]|nr:dehydrogenase [Desulfobacterales bacterium]
MRKVFNWQLKRRVSYVYPQSRPKKQWAMIFDLNKCIACQTCSLACKTTWTSGKGQEYMFWNNVETKPYGGYPVAWDLGILSKLKAQEWRGDKYFGKTLFEAAEKDEKILQHISEDEDWAYPNIGEDEISGMVNRGDWIATLPHRIWMFYLPRTCAHCTYPACLAACPRKAIYKRPEDGIVLIDQSRCRGYRECVRSCPYKKSMFNVETRISEKCVGCYPKIEQGEMPQCVTNCIGKIRLTGFVSTPDNSRKDNPVDYLIHEKKLALPLYPQFGLEPNIYFIPPIHVPISFQEQMFGPGVGKAVETYKNIRDDQTLKGLLVLFGSFEKILHSFKVDKEHAYGFDEKGREIISVPVTEPIYVRDVFDKNLKAYRLNTP